MFDRLLYRPAVAVAVMIFAMYAVSCVSTMPRGVNSIPAPQAPASYKAVDFRRWSSGMYADEYIGRNVVLDGYYQASGMSGMLQGGPISFAVKSRSAAQTIKAMQRGKNPADLSPEIVMVQAPLVMRDQIFPLQTDQRIRVYGRAVNAYGTSVFTRQVTSSVLFVQAERIETN